MSSPAATVANYPSKYADTTRHTALSLPFLVSTAHYPDDHDRLTLTRARTKATSRPPFCPLGVAHCAFDPKRVTRSLDNARRSSLRARSNVVDLARCNSLDHLVTLTAGPYFSSRSEALDAFSAYLADRHFGQWFRARLGGYVVVAEPFAGEGWHLHVAVHGRIAPEALTRLKESWTRFLASVLSIPAPSTGRLWRVNVAPPRGWHTPATLGAYLSKRLDTSGRGERSYRCAQDMARAIKESVVAFLTVAAARSIVAVFGPLRRIVDRYLGVILGWTSEGSGARAYLATLGIGAVTS